MRRRRTHKASYRASGQASTGSRELLVNCENSSVTFRYICGAIVNHAGLLMWGFGGEPNGCVVESALVVMVGEVADLDKQRRRSTRVVNTSPGLIEWPFNCTYIKRGKHRIEFNTSFKTTDCADDRDHGGVPNCRSGLVRFCSDTSGEWTLPTLCLVSVKTESPQDHH